MKKEVKTAAHSARQDIAKSADFIPPEFEISGIK